MVHRFNVCFDVSMSVDDAICSSVEEQVCRKAIKQKLENIYGGQSLDIDDHFVDIDGVDNITVEIL